MESVGRAVVKRLNKDALLGVTDDSLQGELAQLTY